MDYYAYEDNILFIGKMKSGKTYQAHKLIETVRKTNIIVLDSHNEYLDYPLRTKPSVFKVETLNALVATAYSYTEGRTKAAWKVCVFDDIDLYIRYDRESQELANIFIDGRHYKIGCLLLSKRCVNLDKRILQACRYIYVFKGTIQSDIEKILEECSFDVEKYYIMWKALNADPNEHKFMLMDNVTKECKLLNDIDDGK